jgi:hypothetical protein
VQAQFDTQLANQLVVPSLKTDARVGAVQTVSIDSKSQNMFINVEKLNDSSPPPLDLPTSDSSLSADYNLGCEVLAKNKQHHTKEYWKLQGEHDENGRYKSQLAKEEDQESAKSRAAVIRYRVTLSYLDSSGASKSANFEISDPVSVDRSTEEYAIYYSEQVVYLSQDRSMLYFFSKSPSSLTLNSISLKDSGLLEGNPSFKR